MQRWDTDVLPEAKVNVLLARDTETNMCYKHAITLRGKDVQESSCFALGATGI